MKITKYASDTISMIHKLNDVNELFKLQKTNLKYAQIINTQITARIKKLLEGAKE